MISQLESIGIYSMKKVTPDEAAGPCPRCGGTDRFHVHAIREYPSWLWMCRVCSPDWRWLDEYDERLKRQLTEEDRERFARERAIIDQARADEVKQATARFTDAELWRELHRRMSADNRLWWEKRGVPSDWQDYLQLGYTPEKVLSDGHKTPAYTIPYLRQQTAVTMQYRLVNPPKPNDKYRFQAGLPSAYYITEPDQPLKDQVIICEGAIKAMVTKIYSNTTASVLAVPGKTSWAGIVEAVQQVGRVWVILDPDGQAEAAKLAERIGKAARVVSIPVKIDDALIAGMTTEQLQSYFRQVRRQ